MNELLVRVASLLAFDVNAFTAHVDDLILLATGHGFDGVGIHVVAA